MSGPPVTAADPAFPAYDAGIAEAMLATSSGDAGGGLTEFLQMAIIDVGPGHLTCSLPVTPALLNPFGALHGGVLSTVVDHVLGAVCLPVVPRGSWPATNEYKINFIAPVSGGDLCARARILALRRRSAVVQVEVTNDGRLVGVAQGTVAIVAPRVD